MQKLVYILPEYREDIGTHFFYNVELLRRAQHALDIYLIIERGERPKDFTRAYLQRFHFFPLRALELLCVLLVLRVKGYKKFWTHYSFFGGVLAPLFGKSFYWNCGMPWLYRRGAVEEYFFRLALRRSILVTGTEGMKRQYATYYDLREERIRVLPNGINLARYEVWCGRKREARAKLGLAQDAKVVLFLHRLSKRKGADIIMPVAKQFENDPNVLFLVAGTGPLENMIQGNNIKRIGEVSQRDVPMYFAAADVFFMPSEEEGFPHVILEAMAMGVTVVASDVGGVREITPPALAEYIIPQDPELFAQKIKTLLDAKRPNPISEQEREWVNRYDLNSVGQQFLKVISF